MIEAFNHWFKIPKPALDIVKRIVGQLHTASLLFVAPFLPHSHLFLVMLKVELIYGSLLFSMDDVEDGSDLRRGVPGQFLSFTFHLHAHHHSDRPVLYPVAHKIYGVPQTINSAK